jgi:hypothetical protein
MELKIQPKIKALLYGQAGAGKSTLALSAPKPLMIDCDGGIHRVNIDHRTDTVQVESYNDVLSVLSEDLSAYETIVIDTGGKLLDYIALYIAQRNPKMARQNGMLTQQGYGERKQEFSAFCKLINSKGKHLMFVAHRETKTEGDDTRYVPLFGGSNYDALVTELDLVGYVEMNGTKRTITFNPTSRNDGKNTCNLPAIMELPIVVNEKGEGTANTFFDDAVVKPYLSNLEASQSQYAAFKRVIDAMAGELAIVNDAETLNLFVANINKFDHIGSSLEKARMMIMAKARELGLVFDKELKVYAIAA